MSLLAIIGGTALGNLQGFNLEEKIEVETPYGKPSSELLKGSISDQPVVFLNRHGAEHTLPPHLINYRANIWALQQTGANAIIGFAAVGGITSDMSPSRLVIPDQLIDYSYGRQHTFFDEQFNLAEHIDFTFPYSDRLRQRLLATAAEHDIPLINYATYGVTQGPRLETAAEIERMERDGCDIVGMTGMPEAALARELGLEYSCCAVVVNWAAGKSKAEITLDEIKSHLEQANSAISSLLRHFCANYSSSD